MRFNEHEKKIKKNNIASVLWSIGKMESIFKYINYVALYNTRSKYFLRKLRNLQFCLICMVFDLAPCCSSKNAGALSAGANARYYLPITAGSSSRNTARGNKFPWRKSKGSHRPCTSAVEACHRDECRTIPSRRYLYTHLHSALTDVQFRAENLAQLNNSSFCTTDLLCLCHSHIHVLLLTNYLAVFIFVS